MRTEPDEQLCKFLLPFSKTTVAHLVAKTAHGAFVCLLPSVTWAKNSLNSHTERVSCLHIDRGIDLSVRSANREEKERKKPLRSNQQLWGRAQRNKVAALETISDLHAGKKKKF